MKVKLIGAYAGAIVGGLVILIAALLVILQWGNDSSFSFFGKNMTPNTALLILASVAFGVLLPWVLKLLLHCAMQIGQHRREVAALNKAVMKAAGKAATEAPGGG